jgi:hypothetical protein
VTDEAFPLKAYIMKPYAHRGLTQTERIFNYRLSRARRLVENAFGILAARFRVFRSPMAIQPNRAKKIVLAAVVLHNFLHERGHSVRGTTMPDNIEAPPGTTDFKPCQHKHGLKAKYVRNNFADYFISQGQVDWQWDIM